MSSTIVVIIVIFAVMWILTGVGFALFIISKILNKFNNFGDFTCNIDEYSRNGIHYTRSLDEVSKYEKSILFNNYGENPYANIKHPIHEQLRKNRSVDDVDDFFDSLEDGLDI